MAKYTHLDVPGSPLTPWHDVELTSLLSVTAGMAVFLNEDGTETRLISAAANLALNGDTLTGHVSGMARTQAGGALSYETVSDLALAASIFGSGDAVASLFEVVFAGNDEFRGWDGPDVIDGHGGIDSMTGVFGDDTYIIRPGEGGPRAAPDSISETMIYTFDTIRVVDATPSDVTIYSDGFHLLLGVKGTDGIDTYTRIYCESWDNGLEVPIERVMFDDGTMWDLAEGLTITGTGDNDVIRSSLGDDTLLGLGGDDVIVSDAGSDVLDGGPGSDTLFGDLCVLRAGEGGTETSPDRIMRRSSLRFVDLAPEDVTVKQVDGTFLQVAMEAADGSISYAQVFSVVPDGSFNPGGTATFDDGTVWDLSQWSPDPQAPIAHDDNLGAKPFNTSVTIAVIDLLSNDTDANFDPLHITGVTGASGGSVVLNGANIVFTSAGNYAGAAGFDYTISDGHETSTAHVQFGIAQPAQIVTGPSASGGSGNDRVIGTAGDDTLTGGGAHDWMSGGASNDHIDGGTGGDTMWGAAGDDTYVVDNLDDKIIEGENGGTDTVHSLVCYTLGSYAESIVLDGGDISGVGNKFSNTLIGSDGNNTLIGLIGMDRIKGVGGNDFLLGGRDCDTFVFKPGFGHDIIADFAVTGSYSAIGPTHDVLEFDKSVFADAADMFAHSVDTAKGLLITADAGESVLLNGVSLTALQAHPEDYQFI
jgi:Ca2+-binding RTX toxin-like protein